MRLASLLLTCLMLSACRGATLDIELFATPPATLTSLQLGASSNGSTLLDAGFGEDGGVTLPTNLRLLIDGATVTVTALGFDTDGKARKAAATTTQVLSPGGQGALRLDLSDSSWCPAPPPAADEYVFFSDDYPNGDRSWAYGGDTDLSTVQVCDGRLSIHATLTHQYDGMGMTLVTAVPAKRLSFRLFVTESQSIRVFVKPNDSQQSPLFVLPTPNTCPDNNSGACHFPGGPSWSRVVLDIPSNVPAVGNIQVGIMDPTSGASLYLDDVRLTRR